MKAICNITDFGAVGDGKTLNTAAIQRAIDECADNGTVYIPEGVFLSGALHLKSNMTLRLCEGSKLLGSPYKEDYPVMRYRFEGLETDCYASLINAGIRDNEKIKNLKISGGGVIDANGARLKEDELTAPDIKRGRAICVKNAENTALSGITVRQSPSWCVHFIYSDGIEISNIKIHTKFDENGSAYGIVNGDGIDIDSCKNVRIHDCEIASQDDCIAIKSGKDEEGRKIGIPTENVEIYDCAFRYGFGVAMGSEVSGGVRNVSVHDCDFDNTYSVASVKSPRGRGAVIENVTYKNLTHKYDLNEQRDCRWFRGAIYIDEFYGHKEFDVLNAAPVDEGTPHIRNIGFENITVDTSAGNAIFMAGLPERHLENISLRNVTAKGKRGFIANNIDGLRLENVVVIPKEGEKRVFTNVKITDI